MGPFFLSIVSYFLKNFASSPHCFFNLPVRMGQGDEPGLEGRRGKRDAPFQHPVKKSIKAGRIRGQCRIQIYNRFGREKKTHHSPEVGNLSRKGGLVRSLLKSLR